MKIHCCQKIHVIKNSQLQQVSSFLSCQQKNHLLKVLSDQLKCKAKTKVNSKCSNKEMKDVAYLNH